MMYIKTKMLILIIVSIKIEGMLNGIIQVNMYAIKQAISGKIINLKGLIWYFILDFNCNILTVKLRSSLTKILNT